MRRKSFGRNDGQTLVEFALVLPIFLLVVIGVFEFGRAITYWLDLNNTAQVAARYAVVNRYPGCTEFDTTCIGYAPWIKTDLNSSALGSATNVEVCYRDDDTSNSASVGDPVTVTLTSPFKPAAFLNLATLNLRGKATLRLEQKDMSRIDGVIECP